MRNECVCDSKTRETLLGLKGIERGEGTGNADAPGHQCITILSEQDSAMTVAVQAIGSPPSRPLDIIRPGDGDPRHGTSNGYINLLCKCPDCKGAHAAYRRGLRKRRRDALGDV